MAEKAGYKHFMLKEIFEQPTAARETILGRVSQDSGKVFLEEMKVSDGTLARSRSRHDSRVRHIVARGPGRQVHDRAARPCARGCRLRLRIPVPPADRRRRTRSPSSSRSPAKRPTRSPRSAKRSAPGASSIAICNVVGSMATRESEGTIYTHAGPEIGVASTKAFTSQLVALYLLALRLGQVRGTLSAEASKPHVDALLQLPQLLEQTLKLAPEIEEIAGTLPLEKRFPLSRPRHQLSDRARGRAQAEGDLVHPRRGLSGRRDEARADRAHRRAHAGRDARAARSRLRKDARQHAGSEGAQRVGDRAHHTRRRQAVVDSRSTARCRARAAAGAGTADADRSGRSRFSCSRTTSPFAGAATSTSREISRRASRSNKQARASGWGRTMLRSLPIPGHQPPGSSRQPSDAIPRFPQSGTAGSRPAHERSAADSCGRGIGQDARHHEPHRVPRRRRSRASRTKCSPSPSRTRPPKRCATRVESLLGSECNGMWVSTFHALCARLLRREAPAIGLSRDFVIYDSSDQLTVVKQALKELHIDDSFVQPRAALSRISHAKNRMEGPERWLRAPAGTAATSRSRRSTSTTSTR